jgi:predicted transcriptional regulator
MAQTLLEMAKDLVLAQIAAHRLSPEDMHQALHDTYNSLHVLQTQEASNGRSAAPTPETPPAPMHWKKSIRKHAVLCLECGASFKQLSVRHLREHGLDIQSYRSKYRIPRNQPLSARSVSALRRQIVQRSKPWEKAPTYLQAQAKREPAVAQQPKQTPRKRAARAKQ